MPATDSAPSEMPEKPEKKLAVQPFLPVTALSAAVLIAFTSFLSTLSGPIAQGVKLVYAGAVAGIVSRTCCAPLEMVSTVMMCRGAASEGMWAELRKAWVKGGVQGLFKGNFANCLKVAPSRGIQFLVYEFLKRQLILAGPINAGGRLLAGGVAGMVAAAIVYPLEVVKTVLTIYPAECKGGIGEAVACVMKRGGGVRAFYCGLIPTLFAMFPYVGVEFMVYETLKRRWELLTGGAVSTLALLALGALGGCAGQASAHPLDVVRRRMQMQSIRGDTADGKPPIDNMFSGLYLIGRDEGVGVLFKGLGATCLEKAPSTAIGYFIFEGLKATLKVASV